MKRLSQIILIAITLTIVLTGYLYSTRPEASQNVPIAGQTGTTNPPFVGPLQEDQKEKKTEGSNSENQSQSGSLGTVPLPSLTNPLQADSLFDLIAIQIPKFLLSIVAALTLLFFLISAARMLLGASSPDEAAKAKQGMTWAIIGMVLAVGSYAILRFIETIIKGGN